MLVLDENIFENSDFCTELKKILNYYGSQIREITKGGKLKLKSSGYSQLYYAGQLNINSVKELFMNALSFRKKYVCAAKRKVVFDLVGQAANSVNLKNSEYGNKQNI